MLRGRKDPGRLRKRRKFEPKRPTYLSRAKLLELDHDQLVGEIYMRMTPSQFETRCSHNKVHFVLSERHRSNPLWNNSAVISLLAKGPDFIPKPRPLATMEVQGACAKLGYRLVRAFERYIEGDERKQTEGETRDGEILHWTPRRPALSVQYCRSYVSGFFRCQKRGLKDGAWQGNQFLSPFFDRCICKLELDIAARAEEARKILPVRWKWPNVNSAEQSAIASVLDQDVGYNKSDKNYGPTLYSRELFREQCRLHLEDARKGTYRRIVDETKEDILSGILLKLRAILCRFKEQGTSWAYTCNSIIREATNAVKRGKLCSFYIIWKLHKAPSACGIRSRPIAAAIDYVTGPASQFLHCQLQTDVWKHQHVLRDSLDLIRILEQKRFESHGEAILTSADVNALYPSINLERGMAALSWFMDHHTSFNPTLKDLCLKLAHFVLTNNFVECKELGGAMYQQVVGTAMGTSFSVVYAVIFMIWLETPIVNDERFRSCIQLYKRFIDDLFVIWTGPVATLCEFRKAMGKADPNISLDWTGYDSQEDATDPVVVKEREHGQVHFLDLDMWVKYVSAARRTDTDFRVLFRPYRKPGNAYAYIPFNSFHGRHIFRGWITAEILRLLTHSSELEIWKQEGAFFYHHLRARGYPRWHLAAVFERVTWARRTRILTGGPKGNDHEFFETYRACVLTLRNAPEWPLLKERLDLRLTELIKSTCGDIFPPKVFLAQCNPPKLGSILRR